MFPLNVLFCLLERVSKLSNVFYKEREVFKETKDVRKWLDAILFFFSLYLEFFPDIKRGIRRQLRNSDVIRNCMNASSFYNL